MWSKVHCISRQDGGTHIHKYTCTHTHMCVCIYIYIYIDTYTHTYMNITTLRCEYVGQSALHFAARWGHTHTHSLTHTYMKHTHTHTHVYIYIYIYTHTYMNITTLRCEYVGQSALHFAARWGHPTTVSLLLQHGASVAQEDLHGKTAVDMATAGGHT